MLTPHGWPEDWEARKRGQDCSLCAPLSPPADDVAEVLSLDVTRVWLEWRSRLPGYCVVAGGGRHVCEIFELEPQEMSAYWADVARVARAIDRPSAR